jgi:hypothetical protein
MVKRTNERPVQEDKPSSEVHGLGKVDDSMSHLHYVVGRTSLLTLVDHCKIVAVLDLV